MDRSSCGHEVEWVDVADVGGAEPHVTDLLGLYYLDALGRAECALVEQHLPTCGSCRGSADQVVEAIASLALLSEQDRAELGVTGRGARDSG